MYENPATAAHVTMLKNATDVKCETCGNEYFESLFMVKKLSALVSPTGEEMIIPIQVLACNKCKKIMQRADMPTKQSKF